MVNHLNKHLPKTPKLEYAIVKMHEATTKQQLSSAYLEYIKQCEECGYGAGSIIAGIMQNKEKNKKFKVNIDKVIEAYFEWKDLPLHGLSEDDIKKYAIQYDPNELSSNALGSTLDDILNGDLLGVNAKRRKAAYEFVNNISNDSGIMISIFDEDETDIFQEEKIIAEKSKKYIEKGKLTNTPHYSLLQTFIINDKCEGCGICYTQFCEYFIELDDGKAKANPVIYNLDENRLKNIQEACPYKAIESNTHKKITKEYLFTELEKLKNYTPKYPTQKDFKFNEKEYSISIPYGQGQHRYEYSSERAANNAAEREFDSKMYSQIDVIILKIITEYRIKYVKQYYTKEENSFFAKCNQEISNILENLVGILEANNLAQDIPDNFATINIFPEYKDTWKMLNKGQLLSDEMISTIKSEFIACEYSCYWDTDYTERPDGTNWRGNTKWKDKYCYKDLDKAFKQLAEDIMWAINFKRERLEERAVEVTRWVIDEYIEVLQKELSNKIDWLERKIHQLPKP